jgi:hypothetical protein
MLRHWSGIAAALMIGVVVAGIGPAAATDLDVDYGPIPVPPPPTVQRGAYDYMLHRAFHKLIQVRQAPHVFSPVLYAVPSGGIPALTGKCTRDLELSSIAEKSTWYRRAMVVKRWCEVAGLNGGATGWINGGYIKPF